MTILIQKRSKNSIIRIQSVKNNHWVADTCFVANSFLSRLKGLIGHSNLDPGHGLLLDPCHEIHMWWMKIPLDVVFLKRIKASGTQDILEVTSVRKNLQPWKVLPVRDARATLTLELPVGTIDRCELQAGDRLCIS